MIDKPLYQNPLAGGSGPDMGKYIENPNFQNLVQMSNAGMKIDPIGMKYILKEFENPQPLKGVENTSGFGIYDMMNTSGFGGFGDISLSDPKGGDQLNVDAGFLGPKIFDPGAKGF